MPRTLTIDGSFGEGGGQILRTSLALSILTRTPIRIEKIRAKRDRPGLQRQHLMAVMACAEISSARVEGADAGSQTLGFEPTGLYGGDYTFDIGSAGSTTLVVQAVLPALMLADGPSRLQLVGGTHNIKAPPFDYLGQVFLPLLDQMGPRITTKLERYGFYPAGGGRVTVEIEPAGWLRPLVLRERGAIVKRRATAIVSNLPYAIGERELLVVEEELGWPLEWMEVKDLTQSFGPGNVVLLLIQSEQVTELFTGFGERGVRAEAVARAAASEARDYLDAGVPVGPHLADQLLLPLALAGSGSFVTQSPTMHTQTNIEIIKQFLNRKITVTELGFEQWLVELAS